MVFSSGMNLFIGDAGGIVDGHMGILPTSSPALVPSISGDPVAGSHDAAQLLDLDIKEFSGVCTLVSRHGTNGIQYRELVETLLLQDALSNR
jgi:hypothetical protein